jgi:hypothetical protein
MNVNHLSSRSFLSRALRAALVLGLLGVSMAILAQPPNFQRGQELFGHHCMACHNDFSRADSRHLRSLDELRQRVEAWAVHTNLDWRKGEVEDVLYYLNKSFYHFEQKAL